MTKNKIGYLKLFSGSLSSLGAIHKMPSNVPMRGALSHKKLNFKCIEAIF
jgi:hypothetical protein